MTIIQLILMTFQLDLTDLTWRQALIAGCLVVRPLLAHLAVLAVVVDAAAGAVALHLEKVAVVGHHRNHPRQQISHVLIYKLAN